MLSNFFDAAAFTYLFPLLLLSSIIFGYYMARKREKKTGKPAKLSGVESSIIGFFALLLSFTLASAGGSMKERLNLIHQQSDGLANMYRYSQTLPDSAKADIQRFLLKQIDIQLGNKDFSEKSNDYVLVALGKNGKELQDKMRLYGLTGSLLPYVNALSSSTYKLVYSYEERIPSVIMILLILSSLLIGALVGFINGSNEERHYLAPFIYLVLVVLTIQAIRDLDNPRGGTVKPSMDNLREIKTMIELG